MKDSKSRSGNATIVDKKRFTSKTMASIRSGNCAGRVGFEDE